MVARHFYVEALTRVNGKHFPATIVIVDRLGLKQDNMPGLTCMHSTYLICAKRRLYFMSFSLDLHYCDT